MWQDIRIVVRRSIHVQLTITVPAQGAVSDDVAGRRSTRRRACLVGSSEPKEEL